MTYLNESVKASIFQRETQTRLNAILSTNSEDQDTILLPDTKMRELFGIVSKNLNELRVPKLGRRPLLELYYFCTSLAHAVASVKGLYRKVIIWLRMQSFIGPKLFTSMPLAAAQPLALDATVFTCCSIDILVHFFGKGTFI